jgi:hypothetical protein
MENGSGPSAQNAIGLASRCGLIVYRLHHPMAIGHRLRASASFPRFLFGAWKSPQVEEPEIVGRDPHSI